MSSLCVSSTGDSSRSSSDDLQRAQNELCMLLRNTNFMDNSTSGWNDKEAKKVYELFNVKRYIVDYKYILCPRALAGSAYTIEDILKSTENRHNKDDLPVPSWNEFLMRIQPWLSIISALEEYNLSSLTCDVYERAWAKAGFLSILDDKVASLEVNSLVPSFRAKRLLSAFQAVFSCEKDSLPEKYFERYFRLMLAVFADDPLYKGAFCVEFPADCSDFDFFDAPLGRTYQPCPSGCLMKDYENVVAVIEVQCDSRQKHPEHKGPRSKPETSTESGETASATECGKTESDAAVQDSVDDWDRRMDKRDEMECAKDSARKESLQPFLRPLDLNEKKKVRCFLPRLLGQLLACTDIEPNTARTFFPGRERYENYQLGISVVGFRVRFVTMVIVDKGRKVKKPKVSDVTKENSLVETYLYLTEEMDLLKKKDLTKFYRILFAIRHINS